ncbi:MAG: rhomboid family intramembrane serine protease [Cyanobacteria bacterium J06648_11]
MTSELVQPVPRSGQDYNGVFGLIAINLALFVIDKWLSLPLEWLYLDHANPQWYQFATSTVLHANWAHLSGNLFFLYIFGKLIEEEEGILGVVGTYLITGVGANLASIALQRGPIVSLGASGAVFGLFAVSVLVKLSLNWRSILEVLILGQFVIGRVLGEVQQVGMQDGINRIAHLGGAMAGVVLVLGLRQLEAKLADDDESV